MAQALGLLDKKTRQWRAQLRRRTAAEGAARLGGWSTVLLLCVLWVDHAFLLSQEIRVALFGFGLLFFVLAVRRLLWKPLKAADFSAALDAAARRHPELKDYLKPAWELSRAGGGRHTSTELARAHVEATQRLLEGLPARDAYSWSFSLPARRAAACASVFLFTSPWLGGASWGRVLLPWRDVALERFVSVSPGDARLDWGQSAQITAKWDRAAGGPREASQLKLWILSSGGWRQAGWDRGGGDSAGFTVAALSEPLRYRLTWRGLKSRSYALVPVPGPQLDSLRARAGGRPAQLLSAAEALTVRRGDWVLVMGKPNQPLGKALLRVSFLPGPLQMKAGAGGDLEAGFLASEDAQLRLELETTDGRRDPAPPSYALKAQANEPPKIDLLSPAAPISVSPDEQVPVAYSARDDAGLRRITLLVRVAGRETEIPLQRFEKSRGDFIGDYAWDLSGLLPGVKASFRLKAVDDDRVPLSGFSQEGSLEIVDFEAGHAAMEQRWDAAEKSLAALAVREERLAEALESKDAAAVGRELPGLPEAWKKGAQGMKSLVEDLAQDPYSNPGLNEEFSALSKELSRAESQDLPRALEKTRQGDPSAGAAHKRLAEAARKTERSLKQGRALQGLQDFNSQAGRMSQRGAQLDEALDAMKGLKKGQADAKAVARLQHELRKLQAQMESLQQSIAAMPQAAPGSEEDGNRKTYALPLLQAQTAADALAAALKNGEFALAAKLAAELNEQLSRIQKGISQAASQAAGSSARSQPSRRMQAAEALWNEVVDEQRDLLEGSQRVEERRLLDVLEEQKKLLAALAKEQAVLVSSAAAAAAVPGGVLAQMQMVQRELEAGKVSQSPGLLRSVSLRLREAGSSALAEGEETILEKLEAAPKKAPPDPSDPRTRELSGRQEVLRRKTGGLQKTLESLEAETGTLPQGVVDRVEQAQAEQRAAAQSLSRGDSTEGQQRQQSALSLLEQGGDELGQSRQTQQSVEAGMSQPFSRPSGHGARSARPAGATGASTIFVPLPSAKDYLPPKEFREELERSQREKRPEAYDPAVKEYFKRIAE